MNNKQVSKEVIGKLLSIMTEYGPGFNSDWDNFSEILSQSGLSPDDVDDTVLKMTEDAILSRYADQLPAPRNRTDDLVQLIVNWIVKSYGPKIDEEKLAHICEKVGIEVSSISDDMIKIAIKENNKEINRMVETKKKGKKEEKSMEIDKALVLDMFGVLGFETEKWGDKKILAKIKSLPKLSQQEGFKYPKKKPAKSMFSALSKALEDGVTTFTFKQEDTPSAPVKDVYDTILDILAGASEKKPLTKMAVTALLAAQRPEEDPDKLKTTVDVQVPFYLNKQRSAGIVKVGNGYYIPAKE